MSRKFKNDLPKIELVDDKTVGERIAEIRKSRGLSQLELSEQLGIVRVTLTDYERGRSRIYDEMIVRIARVLEISTDRLLGFEQKKGVTESINLRYTKRIKKIEKLPENKIRTILKTLDAMIKVNED